MAQVPESAGHKSFSKRVWGEDKGTLGSSGSSLVLPNALPHTQLNWTPEPPPLPSSHFFSEPPLALALVLQSKARASQLASASFLSFSAHGCHLPQTKSPQWEPQTLQQDRMALPQDLWDCPSPTATLVHSSIPVESSLCPRGSYAREPQISITHCSSLPPDTALQRCV